MLILLLVIVILLFSIWFRGRVLEYTPHQRRVNRAFALFVAIPLGLFILLAVMLPAHSEEQTRLYDARGNSIGTAAPQGQGSVRYYDSRGNSLGTSTTTGNTTTFYDRGGNVTGRTSAPSIGRH